MQANIYSISSPIHNAEALSAQSVQFLESIRGAIGALGQSVELVDRGEDYGGYGEAELSLVFVRTGGTEGIFRRLVEEHAEVLRKPVYLLTSGSNNSLAASLEILSWLRGRGYVGEVIHGSAGYIARRVTDLVRVEAARRSLRGKRIGVIGEPSDWLIASEANRELIQERLGIEVVDVEMSELLQEIKRHDYPIEARRRVKTCPSDYFVGALEIYGALSRLVKRYELSGLTLRCFDLLTAVKNTGCLALALLNEEGVPSSCEGDVPALLTIMIAQALTGETGFQANPSRLDPDTGEIVFAHCTVPLNMVKDYQYDTHFESGIGVGIKGELELGKATLFKVSGDLGRYFVEDVLLQENLRERDLCRTQIRVKTVRAIDYLLHEPIGNHHLILRGHEAELLGAFMEGITVKS